MIRWCRTADLIFGVDEIIEYVSRFYTLKTGDLIFTGTPSGVGQLHRNDNLVAYLGDKPMLDFMIK
jgi:fumarylpyruvate hydrolase